MTFTHNLKALLTLTCVPYNLTAGGKVRLVTDDVNEPRRIPDNTKPASVQAIATTRPLMVRGVMSPYLW